MWKRLKSNFRSFRGDNPGERFRNAYERWQHHTKGTTTTVIIVVCGVVLIVGGLLLGLIPGVPGIVLGVFGLALIAMRFRRVAVWLDWCELKMKKTWRNLQRVLARS